MNDLVKNIPIPYGMRAIVLAPEKSYVPLVASLAIAGFPSPADDYLDRPLDFNELLIENPAATFAVRIGGESMTEPVYFLAILRSLIARGKSSMATLS